MKESSGRGGRSRVRLQLVIANDLATNRTTVPGYNFVIMFSTLKKAWEHIDFGLSIRLYVRLCVCVRTFEISF